MASASQVQLKLGEWPEYYVPGISQDSATKASELLQENHEQHHIFFNQSGFHNHIAHHLLTIYALNTPPPLMQKQYDANKSYQRPPEPLERNVVSLMSDPAEFATYLGKQRYYHDFLEFFRREIDAKGWENVLQEYVFASDERADDMLCRLFAGFLHPIIHLGFGIEFHQPAIIAEALAQTAVHDNWMSPLFLGAEKAAASAHSQDSKSMVQLLDQCRSTPSLRTAASVSGNRIRDGILKTEAKTMIDLVAQYRLPSSASPSDLSLACAEMTNGCAYFTGGAQRPSKAIKMDFYYMHCINSSIFFPAFLSQPWLSTANKTRLLEWKVRNDVTMYASRGSPPLLLDEIENYTPKHPEQGWEGIFDRVKEYADDGHGAKLVRALAHAEGLCGKWGDREEWRIKKGMWAKLGHMAIDSVEGPEPEWVRSAGFDEAWEKVADRSRL